MGFREILAKYADAIWMLNDEEQHRLFVSLVEYAEDGTMPEEQGNEKFVFAMMRKEMDEEQPDKPSRSEINSDNAKRGWEKRRANQMQKCENANSISHKKEDANGAKMTDSSDLNANDANRILHTESSEEKESLPSPLSPSLPSPTPLSDTPPIVPQPVKEKEHISLAGGEQKKPQRKSQDYYRALSDFQRSRFDSFYAAYPKKSTKQECAAWWNENKPDDDLLKCILHGVEVYKRSPEVLRGYALDPIRFLKRRRWDDFAENLPSQKKTSDEREARLREYDEMNRRTFEALGFDYGNV